MDYDAVAGLPVRIDDVELSVRERDTSSGFVRATTVVELHGDGVVGRGEDVTYQNEAHDALQDHEIDLAGSFEFGEFSAHLDGVELFPGDPPDETAAHYRRWGFESAALSLACRQNDTDLATLLDRTYDPVEFVVSTRLGDPPTADRVRAILDAYPGTEFKLDPTPEWSAELVAELADAATVRVLDLKGHYEGTEVDAPPDPELYERVVSAFPDALVEDPALTGDTEDVVIDHARDRVSWDAPITGVDSVEALPFEPRWLNVKPSRFGTVESLFETLSYCEERGILLYGGGQFELDVGRAQIQALASLFYPDAPNDVAPGGYNDPDFATNLPTTPLAPSAFGGGFVQ
jgi:hypothetical protein